MKIPSIRTFFTKPLYAAGLAAFITLIVKYFDNRNKVFVDPKRKPMVEYLKAMAFSAVLVGAWVFVMNKLSGSGGMEDHHVSYNGGDDFGYEQPQSGAANPTSFSAAAPQVGTQRATRFDRSFDRPRASAVPYNRGF